MDSVGFPLTLFGRVGLRWIPLYTIGLLWRPLGSVELGSACWIPLDFWRGPVGSVGFLPILLVLHGWNFVGTLGLCWCSCVLLSSIEFYWVLLDSIGFAWCQLDVVLL